MRLRVLPNLSRTVIILHCFIIIRMMAANGSSQVSQSAPGGVKVGRPVSKGQVLGVWWTDKNVLNEAPSQLPEGGVADTNLVAKIRYSMLSLKGDFMDDTGSTVRYDLIKKSPKFQEYLDLVRQLQYVNMIDMRDADRRAFLINIYNSLVIHALVEGLLKKFPGGSLSRVQVGPLFGYFEI